MQDSRTRRQPVAHDDLTVLLPDWSRHLRAINRAPATITSYQMVGGHFLTFLQYRGMPTAASAITREHIETYMAAMVDTVKPATVAKHYRSLQQLWRWLVDDGEIPASPMARMRPPVVPEQPVPVLTKSDLMRCSRPARATPSRTAGTPRSSGCWPTPASEPPS